MDNHTKRKCGGIYLPSQVEPQSKLHMAQPAIPCPPAGVKTAVEQVGKRQARGGVLLETWGYGIPHQEFRVILPLLLLRLEHLNGDNAKDEEMSGLQDLKTEGKRTILS